MKTSTPSLNWLVCGLLLGTTAYSCKTKDVSSITPVTYTFAGFDNVKLPEVTPTAPAAVSVTAGSITSSTMAAAVSAGLNSIAASGQVPASVQQAGAAVGQAVSASRASELASSLNPDMISSGTMSADMKKELSALANNAALKAYMPSYTLPTVNGKPVGARVGAGGITLVAVANATQQDGSSDACRQAASAAYTAVVQSLDATRTSQNTAINNNYTQLETAANAEVASCQASVPTRYTDLRTTLRTQLNSSLATLNSVRATTGDALYNQLALMMYVGYVQALTNVDTIQAADLNVCTATRDAKIAAAKTARDSDLNRITTNYNTVLSTAATVRDRAVASCHNQGNGG